MKSYILRFSIILFAALIQQLFFPALFGAIGFITIILLLVFAYDSTLEELIAYSFLSGFLVGAMSGSEIILHLLGHLLIGGLILTIKINNLLPSKHKTRILLLTILTAVYTLLLIVPIEINMEWLLFQSMWNILLTTAIYVLLLPLFSRIIKKEQHTLFYGE